MNSGKKADNDASHFVCFGEILWDILPEGKKPGGAPMNVAYHLHTLGRQAEMVSRVGKDGEELLDFVRSRGLNINYIQIDPVQPTGKVLAKVENHEVSYTILEPVAWDFIEPDASLKELVHAAHYFIFGSLAARRQRTRDTLYELLESEAYKIFDINLRPPHFGRPVIEHLIRQADILKLNHHELSLLGEWFELNGNTHERLLRLQDQFGLHTIITTLGANGAVVLQEDRFAEHPGFPVQVVDTIGSGDSFLAAFLSSTTEGLDLNEALETACALGAFVATKEGACPDYTPADLRAFIVGRQQGLPQ